MITNHSLQIPPSAKDSELLTGRPCMHSHLCLQIDQERPHPFLTILPYPAAYLLHVHPYLFFQILSDPSNCVSLGGDVVQSPSNTTYTHMYISKTPKWAKSRTYRHWISNNRILLQSHDGDQTAWTPSQSVHVRSLPLFIFLLPWSEVNTVTFSKYDGICRCLSRSAIKRHRLQHCIGHAQIRTVDIRAKWYTLLGCHISPKGCSSNYNRISLTGER